MLKCKNIIDIKLLFFIFLFMIISCVVINSSMLYLPSYLGNLALKQLLWYFIGFVFIIIILFLPNGNYKTIYYFYFLNLFLLFFILVCGNPINGSKCWLILPGVGSIQPSEFMKIILIIMISKIVSDWSKALPKKIKIKHEAKLILKILLIILPPIILTFLEPDTGALVIYLLITFTILFISPLRKRWFIIFFILLFTIIGIISYIYFFKKNIFINIFGSNMFYRINRLLDWKNGTGMQLENSITAIGSSGLLGHGYKKTPIYFPESGTDFIFSVLASNFGLAGSLVFIILLILFDINLIDIGKTSKDLTSKYIIAGSLIMFLYQQIQNIGMTLGILPITGITLPFISYGGSSLIAYMILIGIILNISKKKKKT